MSKTYDLNCTVLFKSTYLDYPIIGAENAGQVCRASRPDPVNKYSPFVKAIRDAKTKIFVDGVFV